MKYFALLDCGTVALLGTFETFDEADAHCDANGLHAIWIFDADTAQDWVNFLDDELGD